MFANRLSLLGLLNSRKPTTLRRTDRARRASTQRFGLELLEERTVLSAASLLPATLPAASAVGNTTLSKALPGYAPSTPYLWATPISSSQISLSWTAAYGASGYIVDRWVNNSWVQIGSTYGTNFTVGGLAAGTTNYFCIGAYNWEGTTWSAYQSATTFQQASPPSAPSFYTTAVSGSQVNLSWNQVSGATGYKVNQWINGSWVQIGTYGSGSTGASVNGLNANTTYYFQVGAYNNAGTTWANYQSVTTQNNVSPPSTPWFSATAVSNSQVNLTWNSVNGATGYKVNQWIYGSWVQIGTYGSGSTGASVNGLNANTTYYFQVGAYNNAGTTWANYQSVTTKNNVAVNVEQPAVAAGVTYSPARGTLFNSSGQPSYSDVQQGRVGDCWLLAGMATVAARHPSYITSMFTSAGSTTVNGQTVSLYNVRLYNNGVARNFLVDTQLPNGGSYYANTTTTGVLWVGLLEKAYALANKYGWVQSSYTSSNKGYAALDGGWSDWSLSAITGRSASRGSFTQSSITNAASSGADIVVNSSTRPADRKIVGDSTSTHAYAIIGYNGSSSNPFTVYNPWGNAAAANQGKYGTFSCNAAFLTANFSSANIRSNTAVGADEAAAAAVVQCYSTTVVTADFSSASQQLSAAVDTSTSTLPTIGGTTASTTSSAPAVGDVQPQLLDLETLLAAWDVDGETVLDAAGLEVQAV